MYSVVRKHSHPCHRVPYFESSHGVRVDMTFGSCWAGLQDSADTIHLAIGVHRVRVKPGVHSGEIRLVSRHAGTECARDNTYQAYKFQQVG